MDKRAIRTILAIVGFVALGGAARAQQPADSGPDVVGPYTVTSSVEVGIRGVKVDGDVDKYRSDLNYGPGFQFLDSSLLMKAPAGEGGIFDQLLVRVTGWDSDPAGSVRINAEKLDCYRVDSTIRRVNYFNALRNLALKEHVDDTEHTFGDVSVTLFPQSARFRPNFSYEFDRKSGDTLTTYDFSRDEFPLIAPTRTRSDTITAGFDATLGKLDLSFQHGYRRYRDDATFSIDGFEEGSSGAAVPTYLTAFSRELPSEGRIHFTRVTGHALLNDMVDLTGRFIYSHSRTESTLIEALSGVDFSTAPIALLEANGESEAERPQVLADVGVTILATDQLTISNTFRFNRFEIDGRQDLTESLLRTLGGPVVVAESLASRLTRLRHVSNIFEIDYEFHPRVNAHIGYRYTDRRSEFESLDFEADGPPPGKPHREEADNRTNTFIFGLRAKALPRAWTIYFDLERGESDNVFTRTGNYDYNSVRLRNRILIGDSLTINVSGVARDNDNPAMTDTIPPVDFGAESKSRIVSATVDWTPNSRYTMNAGYTHTRVTSRADVIFFANFQKRSGVSEYYLRDNFAWVSASAKVHSNVSVYGGFRIHDDNAAGDRVPPTPDVLISSYPYRYLSPEIRAAFRLHDRVDLTVGYQYYRFEEDDFSRPPVPINLRDNQDYRAHLPYASLRFYFGRRE